VRPPEGKTGFARDDVRPHPRRPPGRSQTHPDGDFEKKSPPYTLVPPGARTGQGGLADLSGRRREFANVGFEPGSTEQRRTAPRSFAQASSKPPAKTGG